MTIYIAVSDEHSIYAPVAGHVDELRAERGEWRRPIYPDEQEPGALSVFQAYETKKGRAICRMTDAYTRRGIEFWIEVGEGYVTDRILFRVKQNQTVRRAGARIGEIILGSLSEVHLDSRVSRVLVRAGDKVMGGITPIAILY